MKKLVAVLVLAAAGALAASSPAAADTEVGGVGYITLGSDYVYVDGDNSHPSPASGYVYVSLSRTCADSNGSHGFSSDPTCVSV